MFIPPKFGDWELEPLLSSGFWCFMKEWKINLCLVWVIGFLILSEHIWGTVCLNSLLLMTDVFPVWIWISCLFHDAHTCYVITFEMLTFSFPESLSYFNCVFPALIGRCCRLHRQQLLVGGAGCNRGSFVETHLLKLQFAEFIRLYQCCM